MEEAAAVVEYDVTNIEKDIVSGDPRVGTITGSNTVVGDRVRSERSDHVAAFFEMSVITFLIIFPAEISLPRHLQ